MTPANRLGAAKAGTPEVPKIGTPTAYPAPNTEPTLKELPFVRYGKVDAWLTSDVFELKQPRSRQGEAAVEHAKSILQRSEVSSDEIMAVTGELKETLASHDDFWPRWLFFVRSKGLQP